MIEKAECLQRIVKRENFSEEEKELVCEVIAAFSEYVVAVDGEYKYNKNFLTGFTDNFLLSLEQLRRKKKCLEEEILKPLENYLEDTIIVLDDAWIYERGKITLKNRFNIREVNADRICYQIKYMGEPEYVIAKEVKIENINKAIKEDVERLKNRTVKQKNEERKI